MMEGGALETSVSTWTQPFVGCEASGGGGLGTQAGFGMQSPGIIRDPFE